MLRQFGRYYVVLIALGIGVAHATQVGQLVQAGASGFQTATNSLRGS